MRAIRFHFLASLALCQVISATAQRSDQLYNDVQSIYTASYNADCEGVKALFAQLEGYKSLFDPVPTAKAYSVNFPNGVVNNPTIADLATDRQARIKSQYQHCFAAQLPPVDPNLASAMKGSWQYNQNGRACTLNVTPEGNGLSASYTQHGYSGPPVFQGSYPLSPTSVKFTFAIGGTNVVEFTLYQQEDGGKTGWISESWTGMANNVEILNSKRGFTPEPAPPASVGNTYMVQGFEARYYNTIDPYGPNPTLIRRDDAIDFDWGGGSPAPEIQPDNFSVLWEGYIHVPVAGEYTFTIVADDGVRLEVNFNRYIEEWRDQAPTEYRAKAYLPAAPTNIRIAYYERGYGAVLKAYISGPNMPKQVIR